MQPYYDKLEAEFGDWPAGNVEVPDLPNEPMETQRRRVLIADKTDVNQARFAMGQIGMRADDPDYYSMSVANRILGGGFGDRLFNESTRALPRSESAEHEIRHDLGHGRAGGHARKTGRAARYPLNFYAIICGDTLYRASMPAQITISTWLFILLLVIAVGAILDRCRSPG